MDKKSNVSQMIRVDNIVRDINVKVFIRTFMALNPEISQNEMARRLQISPMTLSRQMSKERPEMRDEWIPAVREMLIELSEVGIEKYRRDLNQLTTICKEVEWLMRDTIIRESIFKELLLPVSEDFEEVGTTTHGFSYFSWEKKLSWAFVDAASTLCCDDPLDVFSLWRDKITFVAYSREVFEEAIVRFYNVINGNRPEEISIKSKEHSIILIKENYKSILEKRIL